MGFAQHGDAYRSAYISAEMAFAEGLWMGEGRGEGSGRAEDGCENSNVVVEADSSTVSRGDDGKQSEVVANREVVVS